MKTPGEITMEILYKSRYETGKLDPFFDHDIKIIANEIMAAIEAERAERSIPSPDAVIAAHKLGRRFGYEDGQREAVTLSAEEFVEQYQNYFKDRLWCGQFYRDFVQRKEQT